MVRELLTSWNEFQAGIDRLLSSAVREVLIFDRDLSSFKLESPERIERLRALLQAHPPGTLRIAVADGEAVRRSHPRLLRLLSEYTHAMSLQETPAHLEQLRDSMLLADNRHGLVLFERGQARAKLLLDESAELSAYRRRFEEIWNEGGTPLSASPLGL